MKLADEIVINAIKDQAYAALNDPKVSKRCSSVCQKLIQHSNTELEAKVVLKIDLFKTRFRGDVRLDKLGAPEICTLSAQGSGGATGHAKGGAKVTLQKIKPPPLCKMWPR